MGNAPSLHDLSSAAVADLLVKENAAYQTFAEKLFHGDGFLSVVDGNYLLSLNIDNPKDAEAFESIMEELEVSPRFLFKSLENLLRMMQQRSMLGFHTCWSQQEDAIVEQGQQQESSTTLQDQSTSPQDAPRTSLGVAAQRDADIAATGKHVATKLENKPTSLQMAVRRRYSDVVSSGKQPEKQEASKTNQVQLFWTPKGSESIAIAPVSLVDPCPQVERLWKNLTEIVLDDYTSDEWARNIDTNATINATDERGVNEIAHLIRVLGGNRESVAGRFLVGSSSDVLHSGTGEVSTGVVVISYLQSLKNKKGSLACRLETDIRQVKDCPFGALSWQSPMTKPSRSLSATSLTFRPTIASSSTMPLTSDRKRNYATGETSASTSPMPWRAAVLGSKNTCTVSLTPSNAAGSSGAVSPSTSTISWSPIRSKKCYPKTSLASPTTVMHLQDLSLVEPKMIRFRQSLDKKLKETFAGQRDFLEAMDLWNEQEGAFGELSNELKRAFVAVVEDAVDKCNNETSKFLVVRKNKNTTRAAKICKLTKVTIFKNDGVAKRFGIQTYGKTKICFYWAKGACLKGDQCSHAHGEHELVRDKSPTPAALQDTDRQAEASPNGNAKKQKVTGTPLEESLGIGIADDVNANETAASSGVDATGVVSKLSSTIQAGDTTDSVANAASELVQEKVAEVVVPSPVTQDVQASIPLVLESTKAAVADGPLVVPELVANALEPKCPKELKEATNEATYDATMVGISQEDEFDLALKTAMAEALGALGLADEAGVSLEATEENAEDATFAEIALLMLEEKTDAVETKERDGETVEKEAAVSIADVTDVAGEHHHIAEDRVTASPIAASADETGEPQEKAVEKVTASPIAESVADETGEPQEKAVSPSAGIQEPNFAATDKSNEGIRRWGDYDSSSDSDGQ